MYRIFILSTLLFLLLSLSQDHFKTQQLQFKRVKNAYQEKESKMKELLKSKTLNLDHVTILIRVFKSEKELEVWGRNGFKGEYKPITTYPICNSSGLLGPKRKQGDGQTPEGFYHIDRFNPASNFHLSLGINYPNQSDKILGSKNLGGDIFIHGSCVTIGCVPLTDDLIKELYLLAVEAKDHGQANIPVHIFPFRFENSYPLKAENPNFKFWNNLKEGFDLFEKNKIPPTVRVAADGTYIFNK
jgi:murein L,D-transpeptidase YafK